MTAHRFLLLAGALAIGGPVLAQTDEATPPAPRSNTVVYKCMNADGSVVFADTPCAKDPKKMQTLDTSAALRTGSGGHQGEIAAGVNDSDCRDRAYRSTHSDESQLVESNRHIADYQQRRAALDSPSSYPTYNADGSPVDNAKAIDDLNAAIARESEFQQKAAANNDLAYQNALRNCDEELKNALKAKPAPPPPPPQQPQPPVTSDQGDNGG
jgi:hypothetical protein